MVQKDFVAAVEEAFADRAQARHSIAFPFGEVLWVVGQSGILDHVGDGAGTSSVVRIP